MRRAAWWSAGAAGAYALTLTVASDTFYFLAFPGVLGLVVLVVIAVGSVLRAPLPGGPARRRYAVLVQRYGVVAGVSVVCMVLPLMASVSFLHPLAGVGVMGLMIGTGVWLEQMGRERRSSQALDSDVLPDERFRAEVERRGERAQVPTATVAFAHAGTRHAWELTRRRVVRRLWVWSTLLLVALVAGIALTVATGSADQPLRSAGPAVVVATLFGYVLALDACLGALSRLRRARAVLEAFPWRPLWGAQRVAGAEPTGVAVQLRSAPDGDWTPGLSARDPLRWNRWNAALEQGAWFAGDVGLGGVLALPGGHGLMTVQRRIRALSAEGSSVRDDHERILAARSG